LPRKVARAVSKPGRLPRVLSQRTARQLLEDNGWAETIGGKHVVKMTKPGHRPVTLPSHGGDDYSRDLTAAILRQAGLKGGEAR
jgi:predicted RNA binding protein YcfA (HicA-like mRNA interferase family)